MSASAADNWPAQQPTIRSLKDVALLSRLEAAIRALFGEFGEMNRLGAIAAESGRIPKGAFVHWAMQLMLVTVQRGNAEMYRRKGLIISCEQGLRCDADFAVPVLVST